MTSFLSEKILIWNSGTQEREPRPFLEFLISKLIPWLRPAALRLGVAISLNRYGLVIFGATGGIGSALGRQLAPLGCRLTLAAWDPSRLDTLSGELHAEACPVEATDSAAVERCLAEVSERYGRLDGVVNCVGSLFLKSAHATRDEDWANVLATIHQSNNDLLFYRP